MSIYATSPKCITNSINVHMNTFKASYKLAVCVILRLEFFRFFLDFCVSL